MTKVSIKKSDLDRIIKEEALKFKKTLVLKEELKKIEGQLKQLNEVQAGEEMSSTMSGGVHAGQKKPKFSTKNGNPFLKMEDAAEDEITDVDLDDTMGDEDADLDSETINKADVLKAIDDLKMSLNLTPGAEEAGEDMEDAGEDMEDAGEEMEAGDEEEAGEDMEAAGSEEEAAGEEGDEEFEFDENELKEDAEYPIEGHSVAQDADENKVVGNMHKDTHVKEEVETMMESEKRRMAFLAGIIRG